MSTAPQVPAAAAEEGGAVPQDEAHRGGERQQWEDHPDPAADEAQTLSGELEEGSNRHRRQGLGHQGAGQENGAERLGLLRLASIYRAAGYAHILKT